MALVALVWLAAVGFFWAELGETLVLGFDGQYYFQAGVLLALLAFGTNFCKCCCGGMSCGQGWCSECKVGGEARPQ
jgi:hypothetical protein